MNESRNTPEAEGGPEKRRQADERLMHAMLTGHFGDSPESDEQRINRVIEKISRPRRIPLLRRGAGKLSFSAAAGLILAVGLLLFLTETQQVEAGFDQVIEKLDSADQTYRIKVIQENGDGSLDPENMNTELRHGHGAFLKKHPPRRWHPERKRRRHMGHHEISNTDIEKLLKETVLYVRGEKYVVVRGVLNGRTIIKGFDGRKHWEIDPLGRLRDSGKTPVFRSRTLETMFSLLLTGLDSLGRDIKDNYDYTDSPTGTQIRYTAILKRSIGRRPQKIDLWADKEGQPQRIVCHGLRLPSGKGRFRIEFELIDDKPLPEDWFTAEAHLKQK